MRGEAARYLDASSPGLLLIFAHTPLSRAADVSRGARRQARRDLLEDALAALDCARPQSAMWSEVCAWLQTGVHKSKRCRKNESEPKPRVGA